MISLDFSAPGPLSPDHLLDKFSCGVPSLDEWLKRRAARNERSGASRTFVVCHGREVVAYYCLAAGAVDRGLAPKSLQRNMPDSIPVMVLGRLAVDQRFHSHGLGRGMLRDALRRSVNAVETAGIAAVLVHAISDEAKSFYLRSGFLESPIEPMTLCLPIALIVKAL